MSQGIWSSFIILGSWPNRVYDPTHTLIQFSPPLVTLINNSCKGQLSPSVHIQGYRYLGPSSPCIHPTWCMVITFPSTMLMPNILPARYPAGRQRPVLTKGYIPLKRVDPRRGLSRGRRPIHGLGSLPALVGALPSWGPVQLYGPPSGSLRPARL